MSQIVNLPIKVGIQEKYDIIQHDPNIIYICCDSGNIYLGDKQLGNNTGILFHVNDQIPADFGEDGQRCITPNGVYEKDIETHSWKLFSRWSITDTGELAIDGNVPIASLDKVGFVKSSDKNGEIAVDSKGVMSVNGWDDIKVSLNYIFRDE